MKKLLNTKEASAITGYDIETIRGFVRTGKLKALRISPRAEMRFREEWLMNLTSAPKKVSNQKAGR